MFTCEARTRFGELPMFDWLDDSRLAGDHERFLFE